MLICNISDQYTPVFLLVFFLLHSPKSISTRARTGPHAFLSTGAQKSAQSRPQEPVFRRLGSKSAPADLGRTRRTGGRPWAPGERFWRERAAGPPSQRHSPRRPHNASVSRGESMPRLPPVSLPLIPHGRRGDAPSPAPCTHNAHPPAAI